jgi:hypothetical protein
MSRQGWRGTPLRTAVRSGLEGARAIEIGNQPRLVRWASSKPFLGLRACRSTVDTHEEPEEAKMLSCLLGGFGDDRYVQTPADCVRDLSQRHALFGDRAIPGSCGSPLERELVEMGSIEAGAPRASG